jgi:hypothetical protein
MLQSAASKCRRGSYEKMRPVPRKAGIRCLLPQLMERPVVGSYSILFGSLRGAIQRQHQTSLVHLPVLRQSAKLRNAPADLGLVIIVAALACCAIVSAMH